MARLVKQKHGGAIKILEKGETANPHGRPRLLFSDINKKLRTKGIKPLKKEQLLEAYGLIFNCAEDDLKDMLNDKKVPYSLKCIIRELNDKRKRGEAIKDFRDYMFGRATNKSELTGKDGKELELTKIVIEKPNEPTDKV